MSSTAQRDRAINIADKEFENALTLAHTVDSAWYRCQALGWVARYAPESEVVKVAEKAIFAAYSADDSYQVVGASAWPLRALIERGYTQKIVNWIPKLMESPESIVNPVSRLKALDLLWQAVYPTIGPTKSLVLDKLISACLAADSWQAGFTMREAVLVVAAESVIEANRLIASMPNGVYKRQAQRRVAEGKRGCVRSFYWGNDAVVQATWLTQQSG